VSSCAKATKLAHAGTRAQYGCGDGVLQGAPLHVLLSNTPACTTESFSGGFPLALRWKSSIAVKPGSEVTWLFMLDESQHQNLPSGPAAHVAQTLDSILKTPLGPPTGVGGRASPPPQHVTVPLASVAHEKK